MKFDYLREFLVVARSEELQQAARELGISISSLSKHIKAMETELGVPLFIRARRISLSEYGNLLLPYARDLVSLQDEYLSDFSESRGGPSGQLVIALSPIQFRERSGRIIEDYMLSGTATDTHIREAGNSELCELLRQGECDLAFVRTQPVLERDADMAYLPFCADEMVAFLPPEHPLAHAAGITFEQLRDETILLRSERSAIYRVCVAECGKLGFVPNIICTGPYVVYDMVRRGEGVTLYLAPPATAAYTTPLAIVPIRPAVVSFVDLVFRRQGLSDAALDFVQFVQARMLGENRISIAESGERGYRGAVHALLRPPESSE